MDPVEEPALISSRLRLRRWNEDDLPDPMELNRDPLVNAWLGGNRFWRGSEASLQRCEAQTAAQGFSMMHL